MPDRRAAVARVAAAALAAIVVLSTNSAAQTPAKAVRLGFLAPVPHAQREAVFREELSRLGHVEGRNLTIEYRSADGNFERLPGLAADLVGAKVDVIVAVVTQAALAAKNATPTIPIVFVGVADPVGSALVASLARPGGNVTGNSIAATEVLGKQLELLRELLPGLRRVAALWNPTNTVFANQQLKEAKAAATRLGSEIQVVEVRRADALEKAFETIVADRHRAVLVLGDPMLGANADRIARLALKHKLPTAGNLGGSADSGILIVYGANFDEMYRRAAVYVDRILKGAKPADLPIERPTRFELIVNENTAKALGLTIPSSMASRADRVVQ